MASRSMWKKNLLKSKSKKRKKSLIFDYACKFKKSKRVEQRIDILDCKYGSRLRLKNDDVFQVLLFF